MRLVSEHIVEGRQGPTFPQVYPTLEGVDLGDIHAFTKGQPWADYARMRAEAPVMWHPLRREGVGFWAVTRFEDVKRVNGDPETFSSEKGGILMALGPEETRHPTLFSASTNSMINLDALPHRQLRKEHMPYFTASYVKGLRERVSGEVTRLLDTMAPLGKCDMVEKFSQRLPIFTLCEMLGVPLADRERFMSWIHFLEMAQQVAMEQIDQLAGLSEPTPEIAAFIELFKVFCFTVRSKNAENCRIRNIRVGSGVWNNCSCGKSTSFDEVGVVFCDVSDAVVPVVVTFLLCGSCLLVESFFFPICNRLLFAIVCSRMESNLFNTSTH